MVEKLSPGGLLGSRAAAELRGSGHCCPVWAGAELRVGSGCKDLPALPCSCPIGAASCPGIRPQPRGVRQSGILKGSEWGPHCWCGDAAHPLAFKSNDCCPCGRAASQLGPHRLSRDGHDGPSAARTLRWLFAGTKPGLPGP